MKTPSKQSVIYRYERIRGGATWVGHEQDTDYKCDDCGHVKDKDGKKMTLVEVCIRSKWMTLCLSCVEKKLQ